MIPYQWMKHYSSRRRTPVWTSNYGSICSSRGYTTCNTEICEFHSSILVGQDVRTLNISVDDTLVMEVDQPLQNLRNVDCDKVFRELAKFLDDSLKGAIFAEPNSN